MMIKAKNLLRLISVLPLIIGIGFFSACGSGSSGGGQSNNNAAPSQVSFLSGGTYGSLSTQTVAYNTPIQLPYIGGYSMAGNEFNPNSPFFVYGGVLSTFGDTYQVYGNTALNSPTKLRYLLAPNASQAPYLSGVTISMIAADNSSGKYYCVQQASGSLTLVDYDSIVGCQNNPLIMSMQASSLSANNQALQIDLDLGQFSKPMEYTFSLLANNVTGQSGAIGLTYAINSNDSRSTILQANSQTPNTLPANVVANSSFLPNPNGFGFENWGFANPNDLSAGDIADMFGAGNVCYNSDPSNCAVNAYGYYQRYETSQFSAGGSCYGMALASMMIKQGIQFKGKSVASDYNPKATNAFTLNQSDVARLISYKMNNQRTPQNTQRVLACGTMSAQDTINAIQAGFSNGDPIASLNIYGQGFAHAVTPYAITTTDKDVYRIYVYDNNFAGNQNRYIEANVSANTYFYNGSSNASSNTVAYQNYKMCAIPISMQQNYQVNAQPLNSSEFQTGSDFSITDQNNKVTSYQNDSKRQDIPGSSITPLIGQNIADITNSMQLNSLSKLSSFVQLTPYLNASYTVASSSSGDANSSKIGESAITSSYSNGIFVEQKSTTQSTFNYQFHPSARIFTAANPNSLKVTLFEDNKTAAQGYIYKISTLSSAFIPDVSLGALIDDNGNLEVFIYAVDGSSFQTTSTYAIEASYIDNNGVLTTNSTSVTQQVNSAVLISTTIVQAASNTQKTGLIGGSNVATKSTLNINVQKVY